MALLPRLLVLPVALLAAVVFSTTGGAQTRFTVLARDIPTNTANLQIITIRDAAQDKCYLLFVIDAAVSGAPRSVLQPPDITEAAGRRDQRLAELSRYYEQHGFGSLYAGMPANVMPYQFEAQKIQGEYERAVRENELAWFAEQLERMVLTPKVAAAGPAPCGPAPPTPTR